jgi:hypothetical protein
MAATNELVLCVFGIQRTGNHAIISWILANFRGTRVHLNDIRRIDPYLDFNGMTIHGLRRYTCYPKWHGLNRYIFSRKQFSGERVGRVDDVHARFDVKSIRSAHKDLLVLSYEDVFLNDPRVHRFLPNATRYIGESRRQLRVLLLRDPYNHLASLLKHDESYKSATHFTSQLYAEMWKHYARAFSNGSPLLEGESICINFNRWCESSEYRRELAGLIGFPTDGDTFNVVSSVGGGSSFQGVIADARDLEVGERWRAYKDNPLYRRLFDDEIVELGERLFNMRRDAIF